MGKEERKGRDAENGMMDEGWQKDIFIFWKGMVKEIGSNMLLGSGM